MDLNRIQQRDPDSHVDILIEEQDVFNCKYYAVDSFKILKQNFNVKGLSIVCFNIRSFYKNGDEFLAYLNNCDHVFDIIVLTETWGKDETQVLLHIPGYNVTHNFRNGKRAGGVSIFVKDNLKFDCIDQINISNETIESVAIKLSCSSSNRIINVMGIYRPQNGNKNDFTTALRDIISEHSLTSNDTVITGDFNLCLLTEGYCQLTSNFINMMNSNFFRPIITRPTREKNGTATVIDHIWVNTVDSIDGCILYCDITDHYPVFCRIDIPDKVENNLQKIKFRVTKPENRHRFRSILQNMDWVSILEGITDVAEQTMKYLEILDKYYNRCFPLKTKIVGTKRLSKPWITSALHKSINRKHILFKLVKRNRYNPDVYKRYCNTLNNLLKIAKLNYYKQKFEATKQDLKKTWKIINSTIRPGKKCSNITKLYNNNEVVSDPKLIAESLNSHFAGIGIALKNALPRRNINAYHKYLSAPIPNSFYLYPSNPMEVDGIIKELKSTIGNIHVIQPSIIKENSMLLSVPISLIFNDIATQGRYPDLLKVACITALFKSGDKLHPNNYRPISSLSTLNKIF